MELAVNSFLLLINHFESMTSIAIHVLVAIRNATITEQETVREILA